MKRALRVALAVAHCGQFLDAIGHLSMLLPVVAIIAGCTPALRPRVRPVEFASQSEAGTGHVAVLSIAPWEECAEDLQPRFALKPEDALAKAAPTTAAMERKLLDMLSVVARLAPPTSGTTATETSTRSVHTDQAGTATSTADRSSTKTSTRKPGEAPAYNPSFPGASSASELPGIESLLGKKPELGTAALSQYALAAALYQEVQLLNHYVEFATRPAGYKAYLARLQVSLMPNGRYAPYDAYTTLSFFPGDETVLSLDRSEGSQPKSLPLVVPLLVTDDMEAALTSDSSEVVRQYALALSALISGFSISPSIERYTDELVASVSRDFNSLYQVARLTNNSVRVRLGARLHSSGQYFMVPQTHNVTLLLLVPKDWEDRQPQVQVQVEARTEFRHVETGKPLDSRALRSSFAEYREILDNFGINVDQIAEQDVRALTDAAASNDFAAFQDCVMRIYPGPSAGGSGSPCPSCADNPAPKHAYKQRTARRLWVAMAGVAIRGQWTSTSFSVPPRTCLLPTPATGAGGPGVRAYGSDDGEKNLTVELQPAQNINFRRLGVRLLVVPKTWQQGSFGEVKMALPAENVEHDRVRQALRIQFPSLARVSMDGVQARTLLKDGSLRLEVQGGSLACSSAPFRTLGEDALWYEVSVASVAKEPPSEDPIFQITTLPGLRTCGCAPQTLPIRIARTDATPAGRLSIQLQVRFLGPDGKAPATGRLAGSSKGTVLAALNEITLELTDKEKELSFDLTLDQLEDKSTVSITSAKVLVGDENPTKVKGPPGTASVLIRSSAPCEPGDKQKEGK